MSFFSNLFSSRKNNSPKENVIKEPVTQEVGKPKEFVTQEIDKPIEDTIKLEQNQVDKNGWYLLPNGIKFKNTPNMNGTLGEIFQKDISDLGYNGGELYKKYNLNTDHFIIGYFQLLSNKLVGISRNDEIKMTTAEIDEFVAEYGKLSYSDEEDLLKKGIENKNISQDYIESICQQKSIENKLIYERFALTFDNRVLVDFQRIDKYSADARDFLNIECYYDMAKNWYREKEDDIAAEINLQATCLLHLDIDIVRSSETKAIFSYPNYYCNYIAVAAYYKCYDVQMKDFINSTHGDYEYISKEMEAGVLVTKIKAYNKIYTFFNGHSISPQTVDWNNERLVDNEIGQNGYVYVMVNPSLPNMVKIGMTTKDPNERAKELSSATGVPTPFILVFYKPFRNCYITEQRIHQFLEDKGYRVKNNREFFNISTNFAIDVVQAYYELEQEKIENNQLK